MARGRGQGLFAGALLLAVAFAAHGPAITRAGWVWDDDLYVTENRLLVAPDGLARIWLSPRENPQWYPVVFTTFRLERAVWGLDPRGFHATNVALHALASLLLWRLLRRQRSCSRGQDEQQSYRYPRPHALAAYLNWGAMGAAPRSILFRFLRDDLAGRDLGRVWEQRGKVLPHPIRRSLVGLFGAGLILKDAC